jgi:hypothetical protein
MFDALTRRGFELLTTSHAEAILSSDFPEAIEEIDACLMPLELPITEIIGSGGGEAKSTQRLRRALAQRGWIKTTFEVRKTINGQQRESVSHEVDHVRTFAKGAIALEIEWNNKDPFFDRDLENFKRLHADGAISVGVIITRGSTLQDEMLDSVLRFAKQRRVDSFDALRALGLDPTKRQIAAVTKRVERKRDPLCFDEAWARHFVSDKFGAATTHWRKLMDRVSRGVGNPCPLALIGLPSSLVTFPEGALIEPPEGAEDSET